MENGSPTRGGGSLRAGRRVRTVQRIRLSTTVPASLGGMVKKTAMQNFQRLGWVVLVGLVFGPGCKKKGEVVVAPPPDAATAGGGPAGNAAVGGGAVNSAAGGAAAPGGPAQAGCLTKMGGGIQLPDGDLILSKACGPVTVDG